MPPFGRERPPESKLLTMKTEGKLVKLLVVVDGIAESICFFGNLGAEGKSQFRLAARCQ